MNRRLWTKHALTVWCDCGELVFKKEAPRLPEAQQKFVRYWNDMAGRVRRHTTKDRRGGPPPPKWTGEPSVPRTGHAVRLVEMAKRGCMNCGYRTPLGRPYDVYRMAEEHSCERQRRALGALRS